MVVLLSVRWHARFGQFGSRPDPNIIQERMFRLLKKLGIRLKACKALILAKIFNMNYVKTIILWVQNDVKIQNDVEGKNKICASCIVGRCKKLFKILTTHCHSEVIPNLRTVILTTFMCYTLEAPHRDSSDENNKLYFCTCVIIV